MHATISGVKLSHSSVTSSDALCATSTRTHSRLLAAQARCSACELGVGSGANSSSSSSARAWEPPLLVLDPPPPPPPPPPAPDLASGGAPYCKASLAISKLPERQALISIAAGPSSRSA